jgi:hypothetical protein
VGPSLVTPAAVLSDGSGKERQKNNLLKPNGVFANTVTRLDEFLVVFFAMFCEHDRSSPNFGPTFFHG